VLLGFVLLLIAIASITGIFVAVSSGQPQIALIIGLLSARVLLPRRLLAHAPDQTERVSRRVAIDPEVVLADGIGHPGRP